MSLSIMTPPPPFTQALSTSSLLPDYQGSLQNKHQEASDKAKQIMRARLLLLGASALYGTNFSCVKLLGATHISVGLSSTLRFGLAALATSPWLLPSNKKIHDSLGDLPAGNNRFQSDQWAATLAGLEVGLWNSIGYVAQAVGLETTLASKSAFLCSLAVVTVPLLDYATGKHLKTREMLGAAMALVGVAFLVLGGDNSADLLHLTKGDWASLIQPLAFGMGFRRMEAAMHKYSDQANRSTAAQLLMVFSGSAIYMALTEAVASDLSGLTRWLADPWILGALVWTGVITTALTVYMETVALKTLTAAETTLIFSTEPLWGSAFAAVVMGETFGVDAVVGGMLILAGCVYSKLGWTGMMELFNKNMNRELPTEQKSS